MAIGMASHSETIKRVNFRQVYMYLIIRCVGNIDYQKQSSLCSGKIGMNDDHYRKHFFKSYKLIASDYILQFTFPTPYNNNYYYYMWLNEIQANLILRQYGQRFLPWLQAVVRYMYKHEHSQAL